MRTFIDFLFFALLGVCAVALLLIALSIREGQRCCCKGDCCKCEARIPDEFPKGGVIRNKKGKLGARD